MTIRPGDPMPPIKTDVVRLIQERDAYREATRKLYAENLRLNLALKTAMVAHDIERRAIDAKAVEHG